MLVSYKTAQHVGKATIEVGAEEEEATEDISIYWRQRWWAEMSVCQVVRKSFHSYARERAWQVASMNLVQKQQGLRGGFDTLKGGREVGRSGWTPVYATAGGAVEVVGNWIACADFL